MNYLLKDFEEFDTFSALLQTDINNDNLNIKNAIEKIEYDEYYKILKLLEITGIKLNKSILITIIKQLNQYDSSLATSYEIADFAIKNATHSAKGDKKKIKQIKENYDKISKILYTFSRLFVELQIGIDTNISKQILKCKLDRINSCSSDEIDELTPFINLNDIDRKNILKNEMVKKLSIKDFPCLNYLICILKNISNITSTNDIFYSLNKAKENMLNSFMLYVNDWLQTDYIKKKIDIKNTFLNIKKNIPEIDINKWEGFKPSLNNNETSSNIIHQYMQDIAIELKKNINLISKIQLIDRSYYYTNEFEKRDSDLILEKISTKQELQ